MPLVARISAALIFIAGVLYLVLVFQAEGWEGTAIIAALGLLHWALAFGLWFGNRSAYRLLVALLALAFVLSLIRVLTGSDITPETASFRGRTYYGLRAGLAALWIYLLRRGKVRAYFQR